MTAIHERSAGIIPYRIGPEQTPLYLVLHSALVRNPRAKWEFPKGSGESGETAAQTAAREFIEETGLKEWTIREGFERSLTYTYVRKNRKIIKTVTYFIAEVSDTASPSRSFEHIEDSAGRWYQWGGSAEIKKLLYHAKIRKLFDEADAWIRAHALYFDGGVTGPETADPRAC